MGDLAALAAVLHRSGTVWVSTEDCESATWMGCDADHMNDAVILVEALHAAGVQVAAPPSDPAAPLDVERLAANRERLHALYLEAESDEARDAIWQAILLNDRFPAAPPSDPATPLREMRGFPKTNGNTLEDWVTIDGKWHHLTVVINGLDSRVYIDGTDARQQAEIAVFDRPLTRDEIEQHYRALRDENYADTVRSLRPVYYSGDDPAMTGQSDLAVNRAATPSDPAARQVSGEDFAVALWKVIDDHDCTVDGKHVVEALANIGASLSPPPDPAAPLDVERLAANRERLHALYLEAESDEARDAIWQAILLNDRFPTAPPSDPAAPLRELFRPYFEVHDNPDDEAELEWCLKHMPSVREVRTALATPAPASVRDVLDTARCSICEDPS